MSSSPSRTRGAFDFEQLAPAPATAPAPRLEDAAARARSIIATAEAEATRIRDASRAEGYEEGLAAGRQAARDELQPGLAALAEAVAGLRELEQTSADRVERGAAQLALREPGRAGRAQAAGGAPGGPAGGGGAGRGGRWPAGGWGRGAWRACRSAPGGGRTGRGGSRGPPGSGPRGGSCATSRPAATTPRCRPRW